MNKPVIGVTPLYDDEKESIWMIPGYMEVLTACNALPVMLPFDSENADEMLKLCDGFLFTGGHDVNPKLYNEEPLPACGMANNKKDCLEKELFIRAYEYDMPVFGICRGIQFINAVLGGTLYQHIPEQMETNIAHKMSPPYDNIQHNVKILKGTPLYSVINKENIGVNSYHHQGIKDLSDKVLPMAYADDGLVEAIYCPDKKYIQAVQWHPELSWRSDSDQLHIMQIFVDACKQYKKL